MSIHERSELQLEILCSAIWAGSAMCLGRTRLRVPLHPAERDLTKANSPRRCIRADTRFVTWSETCGRQLDHILMVQDSIAGEVTKALKVSIDDQSPS